MDYENRDEIINKINTLQQYSNNGLGHLDITEEIAIYRELKFLREKLREIETKDDY